MAAPTRDGDTIVFYHGTGGDWRAYDEDVQNLLRRGYVQGDTSSAFILDGVPTEVVFDQNAVYSTFGPGNITGSNLRMDGVSRRDRVSREASLMRTGQQKVYRISGPPPSRVPTSRVSTSSDFGQTDYDDRDEDFRAPRRYIDDAINPFSPSPYDAPRTPPKVAPAQSPRTVAAEQEVMAMIRFPASPFRSTDHSFKYLPPAGNWTYFTPQDNRAINRAFALGNDTQLVLVNGARRVVDFNNMELHPAENEIGNPVPIAYDD